MPFQKGGRLVHPVTRLLLYRIYHILILFANTTSRFSASIFHSSLNTDLQNVSGLKFIDFGVYDYTLTTTDDVIKDIFKRIPLNDYYTYFGRFIRASEYKVIVQSYPNNAYGSIILFSYASEITFYRKIGGVITRSETNWTNTAI